MASNAKKKTTRAKMAREHLLRERRVMKQAKKDARKQEAAALKAESSGTAADGDLSSPPASA